MDLNRQPPWPLQLQIDAVGGDTTSVRLRRVSPDMPPHLLVRTGPVVMYCLDGFAVTGIAAAWARAYAMAADVLPLTSRPTRDPLRSGGFAEPVADLIAEGAVKWSVVAPDVKRRFVEVSSAGLTVRTHDITALETHTEAWARACDLGQRGLPHAPVPFHRLLIAARTEEAVVRYHADRNPDRRRDQGRAR